MKNADVRILCSYSFTVFPKGHRPQDGNGDWCVIRYREKETGKEFSAKGTDLPCQRNVLIELIGEWETSEKYGPVFRVANHSVQLPSSEQGVISYLKSLKIGIGKEKARLLYAAFREDLWDVIENAPQQLMTIPGISQRIISKLSSKLKETKVNRELFRLCSGSVCFSASQLAKIHQDFGQTAPEMIRENPYVLSKLPGISFEELDNLAQKLGTDPNSENRISAGIEYLFFKISANGHTCYPKDLFKDELYRFLNRGYPEEVVTKERVKSAINRACQENRITLSGGMLYSRYWYLQESSVAKNISRLLSQKRDPIHGIEEILQFFEEHEGISLSLGQKAAVRMIFKDQISIITGGPGTGKTTVTKAILHVHQKVFGDKAKVILMAPTGRAARHMSEATGLPAYTIHSALDWKPHEDGPSFFCRDRQVGAPKDLDTTLVILDEVSMADLEIMSLLLRRLPDNARLVLVGDEDQLPSVACGNILHELIRSGCIPLIRLDTIFRQAEGSPIIENASRIKAGNPNLVQRQGFQIYEESNTYNVFRRACNLYKRSVEKYGIDDVILLCPYRGKSEINVNILNRNLQHIMNPASKNELSLSLNRDAKTKFYSGDRVMQMRNTEEALNGDIGVIHAVEQIKNQDKSEESQITALVEFNGDGITHAYQSATAKELDLAYCTSVHKSQGTEFGTVILVISRGHKAMLRRNIVYTAITRARKNVAIITEAAPKTALMYAIKNDKMDTRYSLLADRINATKKTP